MESVKHRSAAIFTATLLSACSLNQNSSVSEGSPSSSEAIPSSSISVSLTTEETVSESSKSPQISTITPQTIAICFDYGYDGIVLEYLAVYGQTIEKPEDPERVGYDFLGWDKELFIQGDTNFAAVYDFYVLGLEVDSGVIMSYSGTAEDLLLPDSSDGEIVANREQN